MGQIQRGAAYIVGQKSVKYFSDAPMEDWKAATRKNEILFFNNYVPLNLYARNMYYIASLWEYVLRI